MADYSFTCGRFVVKLTGVVAGSITSGRQGQVSYVCPPGLTIDDMSDEERYLRDSGLWTAGLQLGYPYLTTPTMEHWGTKPARLPKPHH